MDLRLIALDLDGTTLNSQGKVSPYTKEILEKYQLGALKKFGQNFLIDINIIDKIITSVDINKKQQLSKLVQE